ncbi:MAG: methylglyoxal synthase [Actinomycetota bacterium]
MTRTGDLGGDGLLGEPPPAFAVFAEPRRQEELFRLLRAHHRRTTSWRFLAPGPTALALDEGLGLRTERLGDGGPIEIAARVCEGSVDFVIYLRDTVTDRGHDPGFDALLRACDVSDVPVATNVATATVLIALQAEHDARVAAARGRIRITRHGDETSGPGPRQPSGEVRAGTRLGLVAGSGQD